MAAPRGDPLLRGDRAAGRAVRLARHRRRPADGRRAPGAPRLPGAGGEARRGRRRRRPLGHHQRLLPRARRRRPRRRRDRPRQRLARLARSGALLRDHPPRRAPQGPGRARSDRRVPRAAADQGERDRDARLHRGRGAPLRRVRPHDRLPGALHRVHAARRRSLLDPGRGPDRRRDPGDHRDRAPARGAPARALGDRARLPLRRRRRRDRLHQPGLGAVLRRLQPDPADRRRQAAHLPLLDARDRPARAAARGRHRRRPRGDRPRGGLAQGAEAPGERARLPPARADDVARSAAEAAAGRRAP